MINVLKGQRNANQNHKKTSPYTHQNSHYQRRNKWHADKDVEKVIPHTLLKTFQFPEVSQSYQTLWDPMDCSLPGSVVNGISHARVLELVAISFSRVSSQPRDLTQVSHIASRRFNIWASREAPHTLGENLNWHNHWKTVWRLLKN